MENPATVLGSKRLIRRNEFVRIIIQCLYSLGYKKCAASLESESGVSLISAELEKLESSVLNANWDDCVNLLYGYKGLTEELRSSALFLVLRQCFLECLDRGDFLLALDILQNRISTLQVCRENVHKLAVGLVSLNRMGLDKIDDEVIESRRKLLVELQRVLPPPITLPERRLEHLIETVVSAQINSCIYHNSNSISLCEDHYCGREKIPTETVQILTSHKNEVWFVQFSNNGECLATSSRDCTAIIWKDDKFFKLAPLGSWTLNP